MDFLKSAVASAISKGPAFPYSFGDRVDIDQSIWTLHNGTKREDGSKCSIFSFDVNANRSRLPLAKNALRKFRTLRHPGIVKVLDTVETDALIYIATERITPLSWKTKRKALSEESIKWGLHNIAKTLQFINDEASSVHGSVRTSSVFTTESGEWKLGGLDVLSSMKEEDAVIYTYGSLVPDSARYAPPEVVKGGWDSIKRNPLPAVDAYDYGILVSEVFNGAFSGTDQVGQAKGIPNDMQASYKRLAHANPKTRLAVGHFLEQGRKFGSFFDSPLIHLTEGIENLGLKSETERGDFLQELDSVAESDDFPEEFFKVKVLPELLKSAEFGGGGPKVFALVMRISKKLSDEEYDSQITPVIVRLFSSPDRALRVCLLDNLPLMIDHLSPKIVNDKIFPQMVTGFSDLAPTVREQTVKAVLVVIGKLSDRTVNGELLRHLAKTANDDQPGIRTNTTICLGKIARNLGPNSRTKVLVAAFTRSLRDPFVHARNASLMALVVTADLFSEEDCATKLLPAICPSLVDKEKIVRDQANKSMDVFLQRIRKYGQTLPDSVLPPPETATANVPRMSTPQNDSTWTGWAISSFTNKLAGANGDIQPKGNDAGSANQERPTSVPSKEDFGGDWGDMEDDAADAWGDIEETPKPAATSRTNITHFDDQGEPDFEGWLNAQTQTKTKAKSPLPKELARSQPSANTSSKVGSATSNAQARVTAQAKAKSTAAIRTQGKAAQPAATEDNDDDWGEAWG
ncbi:armadillo-type protein [Delphinella strobiligena]|nr:armadillo-type protein [Delphinella strobiligena]